MGRGVSVTRNVELNQELRLQVGRGATVGHGQCPVSQGHEKKDKGQW